MPWPPAYGRTALCGEISCHGPPGSGKRDGALKYCSNHCPGNGRAWTKMKRSAGACPTFAWRMRRAGRYWSNPRWPRLRAWIKYAGTGARLNDIACWKQPCFCWWQTSRAGRHPQAAPGPSGTSARLGRWPCPRRNPRPDRSLPPAWRAVNAGGWTLLADRRTRRPLQARPRDWHRPPPAQADRE